MLNFVKTSFTSWTDFIVQYSVTSSGLLSNSYFYLEGNVVEVSHVRNYTVSSHNFYPTFLILKKIEVGL
jgi:hypothetical protein